MLFVAVALSVASSWPETQDAPSVAPPTTAKASSLAPTPPRLTLTCSGTAIEDHGSNFVDQHGRSHWTPAPVSVGWMFKAEVTGTRFRVQPGPNMPEREELSPDGWADLMNVSIDDAHISGEIPMTRGLLIARPAISIDIDRTTGSIVLRPPRQDALTGDCKKVDPAQRAF